MAKKSRIVKANHVLLPSTQIAWEWVNEYMLSKNQSIEESGGKIFQSLVYMYDWVLDIDRIEIDPNFDIGIMFGYTKLKWTKLVSNYLDLNYLDVIKSKIRAREKKGDKNYNVSITFDNSHVTGKGCLLSLTFSRRPVFDGPIITMHIRSSEVTKRLLVDFLLVQRISEYIYERMDVTPALKLIAPFMWSSSSTLIMYHNWKPLEEVMVGREPGKFSDRCITDLNKFQTEPLSKFTYRVNWRSAAQLQFNEDGTPKSGKAPLKVKTLKLL